jgi:type IV pilus assembly protein PilY1
MITSKLVHSVRHFGFVLLSCGVTWIPVAYAVDVPTQIPTLTKVGAGVPPNLMLTLDDSGSMAFRHMPEDKFAADTYTTTNPIGSNTVRWDPRDTYQTGTNFIGTVPGDITTTSWVVKALRSADTNTIYYNPQIQYKPWASPTGATYSDGISRLTNSPVAAAYQDPMNTASTINLTSYTAPSGSSNWCIPTSTSSNGCSSKANNSSSLHHDPGAYFVLNKSATTGLYLSVTATASYSAFSINTGTSFTRYPNRADCSGAFGVGLGGCTQAQERQNFANWFTYYRTRNLMVRGSMLEAFVTVDTTTVDPATGTVPVKFRLGFGRINKSSASVDGVSTTVIESSSTYGTGGVRDYSTARKTQLFNWLGVFPASGGTPLVEALDTIGKYYSRTDTQGPYTDNPGGSNSVSTNKTCRRSYTLLATDGYWNGPGVSVGNQDNTSGSVGGKVIYTPSRPFMDGSSNTLADVAMKYWKTDLQSAMDNNVPFVQALDNLSSWQNMTDFTIGLGVRGNLDPAVDLPFLINGTKAWGAPTSSTTAPNIDDLWHAALNSRGQYFSVKDPQTLANAIKGVLASAAGQTGNTAGVATAATVLNATNRKYSASFLPGVWSGDINAVPLDNNGQAGVSVWTAASRMPVWSARNIVTWDSGLSTPASVPFKWAALSVSNQAALGGTGSAALIDFLWGDHSKEGLGNPYRLRIGGDGNPFILGDIVDANPVLVKGSFDGGYGGLNLGGASGYSNFLTAKAARVAVLFAGANDGMLHAFKDTLAATTATAQTDGQEVFAYVPRTVYPNLNLLANPNYGASVPHQFFVDGPLRESDAYVNAPGASTPSWRNYLTGSLGGGGRAVFALDVTDSANLGVNSVRWELSSANDSDMGYVVEPLEVGVLPNGQWVAIFGNGFSSGGGHGVLFVVNLQTAAITKLTVDPAASSPTNALGGVAVARNLLGQITNVYAGDLNGNLWKFNYDATQPSNFKISGDGVTPLFKATNALGSAQPITSSPAVFANPSGGNIIVFGTGKLFTSSDVTDTSAQTVYGIFDSPSTTGFPITRTNLASHTLTSFAGTGTASSNIYYGLTGSPVATGQLGWYIDMGSALPGGRVVYPTQNMSYNTALVSLVAPVQGSLGVCDTSTGVGIDLTLPVGGALRPNSSMYDTNGDSLMTSTDNIAAIGYKTTADGIDALVKDPDGSGGSGGACPKGQHRVAIENSGGVYMTCQDDPPCTVNCGGGSTRVFDRTWRRIINPPIH